MHSHGVPRAVDGRGQDEDRGRVGVWEDPVSLQATSKVRGPVQPIVVLKDLTSEVPNCGEYQIEPKTRYNPSSQGDCSLMDCKGENGLESRPRRCCKRTVQCDRKETGPPL